MTFVNGRIHLSRYYTVSADDQRPPISWGDDGFFLSMRNRSPGGADARFDIAAVPFWMPVLLFSLYPGIAFVARRLRRHHHRKQGASPNCSDDYAVIVSDPAIGTWLHDVIWRAIRTTPLYLAAITFVVGILSFFWVFGGIRDGRINLSYHYTVSAHDQRPPMSWHCGGFRLGVRWVMDEKGGRSDGVSFPFWFPCVLFLVYPMIAFIRGPYRRHRRRKKGHCLQCGYNLEGNVSGVCPECGERV
jgi:hypothetical protein